ncbi:hypothetical protein AgCh_031552 [Apium graveolens]
MALWWLCPIIMENSSEFMDPECSEFREPIKTGRMNKTRPTRSGIGNQGECRELEPITANTFEIKPGIIQMVQNSVQFGGYLTEDPNMHIRDFIEICDTFKFNNVSEDAVKLRLFPFSLRDKSKSWLHSLTAGSITTWEDLAQKFLTKFFPMAKITALRNALTQFAQQSGETLCEAWERYKEILRMCPHHGMPNWMIINCFYNGLGAQSRPMLDAASSGALWAKS